MVRDIRYSFNLKRKILFLCIFCTLFFLTGCNGAKITSTTRFNPDGSGIRTVSSYVSAGDVKHIKGGYEGLDKMLEKVSPEGVNLARTMQKNGDAIYEFSFSFSNIEDYNNKVSKITGKKHNATWYTEESIFKSNINFKEEECTYDLVKWAIDAFDNSIDQTVNDLFSLYNIGESNIYLDDKLMYSSTDQKKNPSFQIENAPIVKKVSVYTSYTLENVLNKSIVLNFEKKNFDTLNTDSAKSLLDQYSDRFKIDLANCKITLDLNGEEEIRDFFKKADRNYLDNNFSYGVEDDSSFRFQFLFQEHYNLKQFLSNFQMSEDYVYNYLMIPENIEYKKRDFFKQAEIEEKDGYNQVGKYHYNEDYHTDFEALKEVIINKINVRYTMEDNYSGTIDTNLELNPNGCDIDAAMIKDDYKDLKDFISVNKENEMYVLHFKKNINLGMQESRPYSKIAFEKTKDNLMEKVLIFDSDFNVSAYLPKVKDETIGMNASVNYEFVLSSTMNLKCLTIGDTTYEMKKKGKISKNTLLADYLQDNYYKISKKDCNLEPITIHMNFTKNKYTIIYIFVIVLIVFLTTILCITIQDIKKGNDNLSELWKNRFSKFRKKKIR